MEKPTIIYGPGSGYVIYYPRSVSYTPNSILSNFKDTHGEQGVRIEGSDTGNTPTIRNNWITGNSYGVYNQASESTKIYAVIDDNLISQNNTYYGIYATATATAKADMLIQGNTISYNNGGGFSCTTSASGSDVADCSAMFVGNKIVHNFGSGITCKTAYAGRCSPRLIGNTIAFNTAWGFLRQWALITTLLVNPF